MTAETETALLRFTGRLDALDEPSCSELFDRRMIAGSDQSDTVRAIIERVRNEGDSVLFDLARRYDCAELDALEVPRSAIQAAVDSLDDGLKQAMLRSARNIEHVHAAAAPQSVRIEVEPGVVVTRRPDPLSRVGIYAPGGTAAYASSVLMAAVPARVAGVGELILCSPPDRTGRPATSVLAAAQIAGVDRVFALGGAGAIAAMALGTETVPAVDKIVGPGNAFVAEAKSQLASKVGIDCPAGPSELVIIADDSADPVAIAREVIAQAEHDERAIVLVLAVGTGLAAKVEKALADSVGSQPRRSVIAESLSKRGGVLEVDDARVAIEAANRFAPEHLLIVVRDPTLVARARNAGSIFVGETSSVAFGDYITGANHVLPTGGQGKVYSGLSTLDFVRWTTVQEVSRAGALSLADDTARFADAEGLPGHAAAARGWSVG
ncbi:MAG: histidinol dehydrogenase [Gemmatimonadaceae bacterium]